MPEYRRVKIPGATYFFTLVTYHRNKIFSSENARNLLLDIFKQTKIRHPFKEVAYCLLPDHVHLIWQMPENDADYSIRISIIKRKFAIKYIEQYGNFAFQKNPLSKRKDALIWQRRFWEHTIRDEEDLNHHIDYVHYNPIKHGLVERLIDWKDSSFYKYVEMGHYGENWGDEQLFGNVSDSFGE